MKSRFFNFLIVGVTIGLLSSCLGSNTIYEEEPSAEKEERDLQAYLQILIDSEYDIDTTALGVFYVTMEQGEGDFPKMGDTLEVGYSGYLIDGRLFDSSNLYYEDGTWEFILGEQDMIPGWDDGMQVIQKGSLVQLVIPSELAYGATGNGSIDPYQTLIFVVEMKNIKPTLD